VARPSRPLVVVGGVAALIGLGVGISIAAQGGLAVLGGVLVALAFGGVGWLIARAPVRVTVTDDEIRVRYPLAPRTVAMADVTDVGAGDHVDGVGYGWGVRWEGRGKVAYRVGGPMATVVHRSGRLGLSVEDPHAFVEAVVAARGAIG